MIQTFFLKELVDILVFKFDKGSLIERMKLLAVKLLFCFFKLFYFVLPKTVFACHVFTKWISL